MKCTRKLTVKSALCVAICVLAIPFSRASDADPKPLFTILYTAEAHAALLPCDCPLQPLGGVARRATLIKRFRERGPVILLDGGGWEAGGLYDEDSDGDPARDALRSEIMSKTLHVLNYDCVFSELKEPANKPVKLRAGGQKVAIYRRDGSRNNVPDAAEALPRDGAISIYLSRLGEEENESLARKTHADLILNAGRKISQRIAWRVENTQLVNFDYQARNLVVIDVFPSNPQSAARWDMRTRLEPLGVDIPDDPAIAKLLEPHLEVLKKKGKRRIEIEYWMMPDCPGCKLVRPELHAIAKELGDRVRIVPHWVVERRGRGLSSLHGDAELNEARVQALVSKYYPEKIWDWLAWRAVFAGDWHAGAEKLGLLPARIEQALGAGEADSILLADVELSERRRVHATPSLVIANRLYESDMDRPHLLGALCGALEEPRPDCCKDAPACFFDAQCRKRGVVAKCIEPGTPKARCDVSMPAVKISATVLIDGEALASNQDKILEALIGDLPGLDYSLVDIATPAGRQLAENAKITRLPAYLLDPIATTEDGYKASVGRVAREIAFNDNHGIETKMLLLREDQYGVGANRILARPRVKGRADLFVSRFSKSGQEALETALECAASREAAGLTLALHDILYLKPPDGGAKPQLAAKNGIAEVEEAARATAVGMLAPLKLNSYLLERGKKRGSSYWDAALKNAGIDPEKIRALAEEPSAAVLQKLEEEAALLKSLDAGGEIVLLAENCELISIVSRSDLRHVLERIAGRK